MPKKDWPWRLRRYPPRRNRPPWPMTYKERLYENRKRHRKTEIGSEQWRWLNDARYGCCHCCPEEDENGICLALNSRGCLYEKECDAYYRWYKAHVRFHRPTRKERLYELRKCRKLI